VGRRLTRKQIKQDQFISLFDQIVHWAQENWREALVGLGVVVGAAFLWWGATALLGSRTDAAADALAEAVTKYTAPVGSGAPADAKIKFTTDSERLAEAERAFQQVKSRYWLTPQSRIASFYLGRIALDRGDQTQAMRLLGEVASRRSNDPSVRLATLTLIQLRVDKGEAAQVASELEAMASGKDPRLPRDVAVYELARLWEHEGKPDEANKLYRKLVEDFPDSAYRAEAQQRLASGS
jgi:TolA-binding protein